MGVTICTAKNLRQPIPTWLQQSFYYPALQKLATTLSWNLSRAQLCPLVRRPSKQKQLINLNDAITVHSRENMAHTQIAKVYQLLVQGGSRQFVGRSMSVYGQLGK